MATIITHTAVQAELFDAIGFYEQRQKGLGLRFWHEYDYCLSSIEATPTIYQVRVHDTRSAKLKHFPFSVVYRNDGDSVLIVALVHTARRPNYWKGRIKHG